jgi:hypothetical protein
MRKIRIVGCGFRREPTAGRNPYRFPRIVEYVHDLPDVRWERVMDIQWLLASGNWRPGSDEIAEKILCEYLLLPLQG